MTYDIDKARERRAQRAHWLGLLERGEKKVVEVLTDLPGPLKRTDIWDILLATHGLGREGSRQVLQAAQVWPHIQLGRLTKNQRRRIKENLPERVL